jgi:hypothetical protein
VFAARGDGDALDKGDYARAGAAQDAFAAAVDAILFPALWARLAAMADGAEDVARGAFRDDLARLARAEFDFAIEALPVPAMLAPPRVRARRALEGALRKAVITAAPIPPDPQADPLEDALGPG